MTRPVNPTATAPPVDLTRLEQLAESATPGVWKLWAMDVLADQDGTSNFDTAMPVCRTHQRDEDGRPRTFDAEFIAALRNAAPQLLAASRAVERVRALHTPDPAGWCDGCEFSWPCGTIRALDGSDA